MSNACIRHGLIQVAAAQHWCPSSALPTYVVFFSSGGWRFTICRARWWGESTASTEEWNAVRLRWIWIDFTHLKVLVNFIIARQPPRSSIWTTVLSRPLSCATVKSKAGDGDTLRFGVAKWPQESVRCRKPCASWRINMNQLINYLSARAGFRRKEFNGINGYEKSIKRHSSKTLAMQPFRNSVYLSRSLLLFFWYSCMWRCDALFGSYKIHPPKPILMKCDRPQRKFHTVALSQSGPSELHPESWNTWMEKRGFQGECCESTKLRSWGS